MTTITKDKDRDSWINKIMYSVTLSLFIITICVVIIIIALYFFFTVLAQQAGQFINTVPPYKATLIGAVGVALAYIFKKFK
jgi:predicted PurR-regulated permease PerM